MSQANLPGAAGLLTTMEEAAVAATGAADNGVHALLEKVKDPDPAARMAAAHAAGPIGAGAVAPLARLLDGPDRGVAKAADEALKRIVHYAARPGAREEARAVSGELVKLTGADQPMKVRVEAVRLLENVGGDDAAAPLARLLGDRELREDARLTLERIPGRAATRELERAARSAPADFRPHLEQSLRHRKTSFRTIGTERRSY